MSTNQGNEQQKNHLKEKQRKRRTWVTLLFIIIGFLVYAYGVDTTAVTLEKIEDEQRQTNLFRILRALAHPDILERDTEEVSVEAEIFVPCGDTQPAAPDTSGPYLVLDPPCADPETDIQISGFGFAPGTSGPLFFIPPSEVTLGLGDFVVDDDGTFTVTVTLKDRPSDEVQHIRATARQEVGALHFTETAKKTLDFALETVFMALLATTIGTILAVPLSFLASRNLMRPIKSPMVSIALAVIGLPIGLFVGAMAAQLARSGIEFLTGNILLDLLGIAVLVAILWFILKTLFPEVEPEEPPGPSERILHVFLGVVAALAAVGALFLLADLLIGIGEGLGNTDTWFKAEDVEGDVPAGPLHFIALFIFTLGDILRVAIPIGASLIAAGAFAQLGSVLGRFVVARVPTVVDKALRYITAALAGAVVAAGLGMAVEWLYQLDDLMRTLWIPMAVGALLGMLLAFLTRKADQVATGLTIYYLSRTLFNTLRSIEPLVMAIIFVVWVGIGPFAGALALALHTTAALAKLYSEQVESISLGPIEAVQATGANRLQTIMYAVVPQIVPPYISFTLYRWDINVRMSTIIGFVGGGGLGLLLQQNVNLLNYRAAAVQMFAIAIIVATMDYVSARLRERLV